MSNLTAGEPWLTPEDVKTHGRVTFTGESRKVPKSETGFKDDSFEIVVKLPNNEPRSWTMNKTSQRAVARQLGFDELSWMDHTVPLKVVPMNIGGKDIEAVMVDEEAWKKAKKK